MRFILLLASVNLIISLACGRKGYGPGKQDWGFIDITTEAHMFYWLFYTEANVKSYTERPLVLWLAGGPGSTDSGHANFNYFGAMDLAGQPREYAWVKYVNVLLIDSPLGAGYSYVDDKKRLPHTNAEVAKDLVETMRGFYKKHPEFKNVPLHVFGESYAGKMGAEFAYELWKASQSNSTAFGKLRSLNMGNPWISPADHNVLIPRVTYDMGLIDEDQRNILDKDIQRSVELMNQGQWKNAIEQFWAAQKKFCQATGVYFENVLKTANKSTGGVKCDYVASEDDDEKKLNLKMNSDVKSALQIPQNVVWGAQVEALVEALIDDILKPATHFVELLLKDTDVKVSVFSGNLDALCTTAGSLSWISKLNWARKSEYTNASRDPFYVDDVQEGFEKSGGGMSMFWILRAGHLMIIDKPSTVVYILKRVTGITN